MDRERKAQVITEIAEEIDSAEAIYAIDYRGLSVPQAAELRAALRQSDASFRIVKNTLTLRAVEKSSADGAKQLKDMVSDGPTALTFIKGDPAAAAKALDSFARDNEVLDFKGGTLGPELLSADDIKQIAKLPSRERLNAQLAGVVASPLTTLVRGLGSMVSGLAIALGQLQQQKAEGAPAPPEEPEPEKPEEETSNDTENQASDSSEQETEEEAGQ